MTVYGPIPMDLTPPPLSAEERSRLGRLPGGGCIQRAKPLHFTFNGASFLGLEGDTLASALLANQARLASGNWTLRRARGLLSPGADQLASVFHGRDARPRTSIVRMSEVALFDGLVAQIHVGPLHVPLDPPSVDTATPGSISLRLSRKTFATIRRVWGYFERHVLSPNGMRKPARNPLAGPEEECSAICDVLVVGGGVAGLSAALAAGTSGARVMCVDQQTELGGWLLCSDGLVDGLPAKAWVANALERLRAMPAVTLLSGATVLEYHEHNRLLIRERRIEPLDAGDRRISERLWNVRAEQVVLATGSHERSLNFPNNELPGVMLASEVSAYIRRFAVLPGSEAIVFTNNDAAYDAAFALKSAGAHVKVIDSRALPAEPILARANALGIPTRSGHAVVEAVGIRALRAVEVHRLGADGSTGQWVEKPVCDLLVVSGGFDPEIGLHRQSGATPQWLGDRLCWVPGPAVQAERSAGACNGLMGLEDCASDGNFAGLGAAKAAGFAVAVLHGNEDAVA